MTSTKKKVLVVDDVATVRTQLVGLLGPDYECVTAADGAQALAAIKRDRPDVVITDLEMPVMDGVELLRKLRSESATRELPVIVATTSTALDRVNECRALGCAGFVLKPIQQEYVRAKISQILARSAAK